MPAKDDDQKKKDKENVEIDFGIGKISFGGLLRGIGSLIDSVAQMDEEGKEEVNREGEFMSPSGRVKAIYGFSVKTDLGGKPTVEPFGNVRRTPRGPVVEEEREPLVDVFDEKDHVLVIIELPGVEEEHISTKVNGDILILSATDEARKYYKEVVLPKDVDTDTLTRKYKNGVLEIRISKK
jgi:HSP20 family molecular chaperone IbpA